MAQRLENRREIRRGVARRVAAARALRDWTQAELGDRSGLGRATISDIERATRGLLVEELPAIAAACDLPITWFFEEAGTTRV